MKHTTRERHALFLICVDTSVPRRQRQILSSFRDATREYRCGRVILRFAHSSWYSIDVIICRGFGRLAALNLAEMGFHVLAGVLQQKVAPARTWIVTIASDNIDVPSLVYRV